MNTTGRTTTSNAEDREAPPLESGTFNHPDYLMDYLHALELERAGAQHHGFEALWDRITGRILEHDEIRRYEEIPRGEIKGSKSRTDRREQGNPEVDKVTFDLALDLNRVGEHWQAISLLTVLERTGFQRKAVIGTLGAILFYDLGEVEEALPYLQEAVFLSPYSELASLALFHARIDKGETERAFDEARRFLSLAGSEEYRRVLTTPRDSSGGATRPGAIGVAPQFFSFFEWVYEGVIPAAERRPIELEIERGLAQADKTVEELMQYVAAQREKTMKVTDRLLERKLIEQGRAIFRNEFAKRDANGRGRVLSALHAAIERLYPQRTGLAPDDSAATSSPRATTSGGIRMVKTSLRRAATSEEVRRKEEVERTIHNTLIFRGPPATGRD
jgi:tetratricopeptide (TPR) repeat protein